MTYIYFTEFYKKICDILSKNTEMPSQASSLSSTCDSDIVRIKGYLTEIIGSKWKESGAEIIRNNIVIQISKNVTEISTFIKNNLEESANISINKLLPELKDMKMKDELLYTSKTTLASMKSSLTIQQNNMPSKYRTDEDGIKHIRSEYNDAVNRINRLIQEINNLSRNITEQTKALNGIKSIVDAYIMEISALGNENIVIPMVTLPNELLLNDLPLMKFEEETDNNLGFAGGTVTEVIIGGINCKMFVPNGYVSNSNTKLTVYLSGSGDEGDFFDHYNAKDSFRARTFPKGPILIVVSERFKTAAKKKGFTKDALKAQYLANIIEEGKLNFGITNKNINVVAFSLGTTYLAPYVDSYGSTIDKAVLISPSTPGLKGLVSSPQYRNIDSVQILQADNEEHGTAYAETSKLSSNPNTTLSYFNGKHGDYERVLAGMYIDYTSDSKKAPEFIGTESDYVDPNFDLWDFVN